MRLMLLLVAILPVFAVMVLPTRGASSPPQGELVQNGSFEEDTDGDGVPDFWQGRHLGPQDIRVQDPYESVYSFQLVGEPGVSKRLMQSIRAPLPRGTVLSFRAAVKVEGASREGGKVSYKIEFIWADNTHSKQVMQFSRAKEGWQQGILGLNLLKDLRKIIVSIMFVDQTGTALFDDIHAEVK